MKEETKKIIGVSIIVGILVFSFTSSFMYTIVTSRGHSDVMTRCAIESLDMANDFVLVEDWTNASKFFEVAGSFLWRASWEHNIVSKNVQHEHIQAIEIVAVRMHVVLEYPRTYGNETDYWSFNMEPLADYPKTEYEISVENVTFAINAIIGELLPYSDIDPRYNTELWEKYSEYYKEIPTQYNRILLK